MSTVFALVKVHQQLYKGNIMHTSRLQAGGRRMVSGSISD